MNCHCRMLALRGPSLLLGMLVVGACLAKAPPTAIFAGTGTSEKSKEPRMWMTINEHRFAISLADNDTARAFAAQLPLTLHMEELNGNEKHAKLPTSLPANASRPGIIRNGDLMLYGANTLVVFSIRASTQSIPTPALGEWTTPPAWPRHLDRELRESLFLGSRFSAHHSPSLDP